MRISIDFETRSRVDLRKTGVYAYAESKWTDIVCMAWAIDAAAPRLWRLGEEFPADFPLDAEYRAWNANFERVLWQTVGVERYGWPAVPLEQWHCTMAEAAAMALPRSLGQCAEVLGVSEQKEDPGHNFVLRMSKPRSTKGGEVVWWTDPDRLERLYKYCIQDVRTERAIMHAVHRLGPRERRVYLLDQRINDRGLLLDVPLARGMQHLSELAVKDADQQMFNATGLVTGVTKVSDLTSWLNSQGVEVDGVAKNVVRDLLAGDDLAPNVRLALEARQDAGKSSVAKIRSALGARCADNRVRGTLVYHGANTGRWAGRLVQPQNFPRGEIDATPYIEQVRARDYAGIPQPMNVVSSMLRQMFVAAPGHRFMVGDFAQIEARVLAWLAGQHDLVAAFRRGDKIYERMAALIYDCVADEITKDDPRRHMGKSTVLGCGFGMGAKKFAARILEVDGIVVPPEIAERAVRAYRAIYPRVVQLWNDLEVAAHAAIVTPGEVFDAGNCRFTRRGGYLWIILPSRRPLAYALPALEMQDTPWGEERLSITAYSVHAVTKQWGKRTLYGGLLVENITQAVARDIMVDAMLELDRTYPIVLTVHDEIVSEVPNGQGSLEEFASIARSTPSWAGDCPVDFEAWEGERYKK